MKRKQYKIAFVSISLGRKGFEKSPLRFGFICRCLLLLFLTACATKSQTSLEGKEYFDRGIGFMRNANYQSAIEEFRQIELLHPLSPYNPQSKLEIVSAYYGLGDYEEAISAAENFIAFYPDSDQLDFAYYMIGRSYYAEGGILLNRFSRRTMEYQREAYGIFQKLIDIFPTSHYVAEARAHQRHIRNILAEDEVETGKFYYRKQAYLAAVQRGIYVLQHFPRTPAVADALALMMNAYIRLGMTDSAQESQQLLENSFPNYAGFDI